MLKTKRIVFNRNELAGAFGDLGVAIPLITAMLVTNGLDPASVFILFGLMHIYTGFAFGLPMPVQPLKAMAVIMLTVRPPKEVLYAAGLVVGVFFAILALTNLVKYLDRIPRSVTRGIQFGLGVNLILIALGYMQREAYLGYLLAIVGVVVTVALYNSRRIPPALLLVLLGLGVAVAMGFPTSLVANGVGIDLPKLHAPTFGDILSGAVLLAVPQIPLSIGNSIIATSLLTRDLFPAREATARKLSFTYGAMNLVSPFFSGIPVCHGAGGLAGHYRFGGRTGGAVVIIGVLFVILGLFFSGVIHEVLRIFPFALLGVILFFAGLELALLLRDVSARREDFFVALVVGMIIIGLPYGYAIGLALGLGLAYLLQKNRLRL